MINPYKNSIKNYVSIMLIQIKALKIKGESEDPFTYTSGNKGPIYVDNRKIISYPIFKNVIASFFAHILEFEIKEDITCIIGGETAGMSFAEHLADLLNKIYFYVRKQSKGYGIKSRLVGDLNMLKGKAVLIEDLITDGGSKISFIEGIRDNIECNHTLVVFDREQGGAAKLKKMGVSLHSLTTLKDTLKIGKEYNFINSETYDYVQEYLQDPKSWSEKRDFEWFD